MAPEATPVTGSRTHVEACCSTGTSPGAGRFRPRPWVSPHPASVTRSHGAPIRHEVHGPPDGPPVVVLGGISANHHLCPTATDESPGWWPGVVGPGQALDPARHRLIGIEWCAPSRRGGPGATSAAEQAHALRAVLDTLQIDRVTIVGASFGGMVALAFAEEFPDRVDRLVVLCAAHRPHPMATALRAIQRRIVRLGVALGRTTDGLALARSLGMATYRSAEEFESRFSTVPTATGPVALFPVEAYLEARGRVFAGHFPAEDFLALSESIDTFHADPALVGVPVLLVSFDTDTLVPPWLVDELAHGIAGPVEHRRLTSPYGHDAFLKETVAVSSVLADVFGDGEGLR